MLPPGHPREFLSKVKSRSIPARGMGPSLGEIKQAEDASMKLSAHKIRHFMDLKNTTARALRVMSPGKEGGGGIASMGELLSRMR